MSGGGRHVSGKDKGSALDVVGRIGHSEHLTAARVRDISEAAAEWASSTDVTEDRGWLAVAVTDLLGEMEALRKEIKVARALVDHLNDSVTWEKKEHDQARDEWFVMRDNLRTLHRRLTSALETVEPPETWEPSWADYGDGLEADPYGWLATLVAEALAEYPPPLTYDEEATAKLPAAPSPGETESVSSSGEEAAE